MYGTVHSALEGLIVNTQARHRIWQWQGSRCIVVLLNEGDFGLCSPQQRHHLKKLTFHCVA